MDKDRAARDYQKHGAGSCAQAGIRAEMYLGTAGMKAQMKYADKRGAPCVVIQGGDERAKGEVQIKDLIEGAKAAATIKDSKEWREGRPAQFVRARSQPRRRRPRPPCPSQGLTMASSPRSFPRRLAVAEGDREGRDPQNVCRRGYRPAL